MDVIIAGIGGGLWILPAAMLIDAALGDPEGFYHPVITLGKVISWVEKKIRRCFPGDESQHKETVVMYRKRLGGLVLVITTLFFVVFVLRGILTVSGRIGSWISTAVMLYFTYAGLAGKCLEVEALKVRDSLMKRDLTDARRLIGFLVGRDTDSLDEEGIVKATVETVAENTIDGVLAPVFYWLAGYLLGYPLEGLWLYKAVNTLDSMVGYQQEPYRDLGFVSAKLDDLANFVPARLGSGFMMTFGAGSLSGFRRSLPIFLRDRKAHKSPNAGHPEAVVAGILGIQLGGSHRYFGTMVEKPTIGDDSTPGKPEHITRSVGIMKRSMWFFALCLLPVAVLLLNR